MAILQPQTINLGFSKNVGSSTLSLNKNSNSNSSSLHIKCSFESSGTSWISRSTSSKLSRRQGSYAPLTCSRGSSLSLTNDSRNLVTRVNSVGYEVDSKEQLLVSLHKEGEDVASELNGSNIFLIGMMGCGKTTVGRILSDVLGFGFFDSDSVVEKAAGTAVSTIFAEQGEQAFRDMESQAISQLSSMEGLIVATGGGAILRSENWKCMRQGVVVWIDVPLESLAQRVVAAGISSRPILNEGSTGEEDMFSQTLDKLKTVYGKRRHIYPQADVRVSLEDIARDCGNAHLDISPALIAQQILLKVKSHLEMKYINEDSRDCKRDELGICIVPLGLEQSETFLRQSSVVSQ